jgi:light-regulated signal transduction histidine kinase (bacteriophytochrome)
VEHSPAFGQADLTNCERELIHLAGSVQPHGVLLVLRERDGVLVQVSANTDAWLGLAPAQLLGQRAAVLGGDLGARLQALVAQPDLAEPRPLQARTQVAGMARAWQAAVHRVAAQGVLVIELEADDAAAPEATAVRSAVSSAMSSATPQPALMQNLADAVQRFGQAASIGALCDDIAACVRGLTGYDRVMVYKFDPDGHGKIIAEARDVRLDPLLGHHYPASDIPQRARQLYLANRVRVLVDVHYQPVPLVPALLPADAAGGRAEPADLDMSMCFLRSMSPLHLQYLKNMGVTGTLVVSLVRDGGLWGLIAAHHDSARAIGAGLRAACDLLAEVAATRIAAIENYAHAQVAILVRRLEQRLVEATST